MNKRWTPETLQEATNKISGLTRRECEARGLSSAWQAVFRSDKNHNIAADIKTSLNTSTPIQTITVPLVRAQDSIRRVKAIFGSAGDLYLTLKENKLYVISKSTAASWIWIANNLSGIANLNSVCIPVKPPEWGFALFRNTHSGVFYISRDCSKIILNSRGKNLDILLFDNYIDIYIDSRNIYRIKKQAGEEVEFVDEYILKASVNTYKTQFITSRTRLLSYLRQFNITLRKSNKSLPEEINLLMGLTPSLANQKIILCVGMKKTVKTNIEWTGEAMREKRNIGCYIDRRDFFRAIKYFPSKKKVKIIFIGNYCYIFMENIPCLIRLYYSNKKNLKISPESFLVILRGAEYVSAGTFIQVFHRHLDSEIREFIFLSPSKNEPYNTIFRKTSGKNLDKREMGAYGNWIIDRQKKILTFQVLSSKKLNAKCIKGKLLQVKMWNDYKIILN